ncbi:MAG: 6-phosphofructokinase [Anaerolineae bacterium]|nr:6-phosphofructokinase [Anaerolineae bacterium]NUQ04324.1 6-phosphofructokinase [Anaerolineae bacterium]
MKKIAVLTSGGDAPGMNAAIRAVVRTGIGLGAQVYGVRQGYQGLIEDLIQPMGARDVGGIIQVGGTVLGSARSKEFMTPEGREKAKAHLEGHGIEGLVVVGGNGSQTGAKALDDLGFPVVGIASTIDNDLAGSEITIGVDTALNIALEAIDRLKVTASSHRRAFLVEVMGRDCGYLALMAGIAGGAEAVVIPEVETKPETLVEILSEAWARGKSNGLIVVAEGASDDCNSLYTYLKSRSEEVGYDIRMTILGHVQRGGVPTAFDRLLATRLASEAARQIVSGNHGVLVGWNKSKATCTPYEEVVGVHKPLDMRLFEMADILAQ